MLLLWELLLNFNNLNFQYSALPTLPSERFENDLPQMLLVLFFPGVLPQCYFA